jgi:hypothetical protein
VKSGLITVQDGNRHAIAAGDNSDMRAAISVSTRCVMFWVAGVGFLEPDCRSLKWSRKDSDEYTAIEHQVCGSGSEARRLEYVLFSHRMFFQQ